MPSAAVLTCFRFFRHFLEEMSMLSAEQLLFFGTTLINPWINFGQKGEENGPDQSGFSVKTLPPCTLGVASTKYLLALMSIFL